MAHNSLKEDVFIAASLLGELGMTDIHWSSISAVNRRSGVMGIHIGFANDESGDEDDVELISLKTGGPWKGKAMPPPEAAMHRYLYQQYPDLGAILCIHPQAATSWALARRPLPCFGVIHADCLQGNVPVARALSEHEIQEDFERNIAKSIVECMSESGLTPLDMPAVLVPYCGPVVWGQMIQEAVHAAIVLEASASQAIRVLQLDPNAEEAPRALAARRSIRSLFKPE